MKIQCDVCEKAPATLICCADEAALCARCDVEVHAANKLASKHQRLLLQTLSNKLPPCDICQEKSAFIFCVEDRALFCRDCDEPVHSAGSLAANHQRFLATGIRVALSSSSAKETGKNHQEPPPSTKTAIVPQAVPVKAPTHQVPGYTSPSWGVDDLLQFSDFESPDKKEQLEFGELEWLTDYGVFCDEAAEVPQLPTSQPINTVSYRQTKLCVPHNKKPKYEIPYIEEEDDDEHFTLPDLAVDMLEPLRILDSSLSRTNWRLKASSKRRLQTDILALCTGMRPVIMIDYGGKMPELRDRLCAFLKFSQEESSIFESFRVMVIEDMIYLICVRGIVELIKLTINKELELHYVDLEHDPPKMVTEVEKISIGAQFISLQKMFFSVFCDDVSDCRLPVNNQPSDFIDLSHFMQDTSVLVPTLNGWLLGYPVVYIFGKDHIQDAVYNLSTKSLNLFNVFVRRNSSSSKRPPQEELMRSDS